MEDLYKSFAEELEERKLNKAWLKPGQEAKASMSDKTPHPTMGGKQGVGHTKDVATKRKELIESSIKHTIATDGAPKGSSEKEIRETHEFNHSPSELSDEDVHEDHKRLFPKQYQ